MKSLINIDFVKTRERLKNLGCRPVNEIKMYEQPYKILNQKKRFVQANIIAERAKRRFN